MVTCQKLSRVFLKVFRYFENVKILETIHVLWKISLLSGTKSKAESKAEAKAEIIKTGDWRDLYDAVGNPLFETSDESSDEDEE